MSDRFNIADVARIHGLSVIKSTNSEVYCVCPFCNDKRGKFAYVINKGTKKNIYNCFNCRERGNAVDLHMKLSMSDYSDEDGYNRAIREIFTALNGDEILADLHKKDISTPVIEESIKTSDQVISKVYYALLKELTLRPEHKKDLLRRGLTETDIVRFHFKSTPKDSKGVCNILIKKGYNLEGVPGFYKEPNGSWNLRIVSQGYLCPVFDGEYNYIIGFQVRVDKPFNDAKYLWLSSAGKECGVSSGALTTYLPGKSNNVGIVVEGILKALVVYSLLNGEISVYGVPGTKAITSLKPYLERLDEVGYLFEAYDMDKHMYPKDEKIKKKTEGILEDSNKLRSLMEEYGIDTKPLTWDYKKEKDNIYWKEEYKGLDDFLLCYEHRELFINYLLKTSKDVLSIKKYLKN